MKMAKRVLAVFLAVLLIFGSLAEAAFASSGEPAPEITEEPAPEVTDEPAVPEEEPAEPVDEPAAPETAAIASEPEEQPVDGVEPAEIEGPDVIGVGETITLYGNSSWDLVGNTWTAEPEGIVEITVRSFGSLVANMATIKGKRPGVVTITHSCKYVYKATNLIAETFEERGVAFQVEMHDEDEHLTALFPVDCGPIAAVRFISSDDDNDVAVRIYGLICNVPKEKRAGVLEACNALNLETRHVKFTLGPSGNVNVEYDFPLATPDDSVGKTAFEMIIRLMPILDENYSVFVKALYSRDELDAPQHSPVSELLKKLQELREMREAHLAAMAGDGAGEAEHDPDLADMDMDMDIGTEPGTEPDADADMDMDIDMEPDTSDLPGGAA